MPITGIVQPDILPVSSELRLRRYDGAHDFAFAWYQDPELVRLVDGVAKSYDRDTLDRMYAYLNGCGELYFIETLEDNAWRPIGDVTLCREDMPIVIGEAAFRGRGVGRAVISALIGRARSLGWDSLQVREIYDFNTGSHRLFTGLGFQVVGKTDKGQRYKLMLSRRRKEHVMYTLQQLTPADGRAMYDLLQRIGPNENGFVNAVNGMDYAGFSDWLLRQDEIARGVGLEDWMVPSVTYWLMEGGRPIGIGRLRLGLTDALRKAGGNIGYAIDPLRRGRGCGKALLSLLLEEARRREITELLVTVYPGNTASRRVAEGCGGVCRKVTEERAYYDFH